MPLARTYRFTAYNATTQTIASSGIVVTARRWKFGSTGTMTYESSSTSVLTNGSTLANVTYLNGSTIDNSTDLFLGGDFLFSLTSPSSSAGDVTVFYEISTDGGTTWPVAGRGYFAKTISASGANSYAEPFTL